MFAQTVAAISGDHRAVYSDTALESEHLGIVGVLRQARTTSDFLAALQLLLLAPLRPPQLLFLVAGDVVSRSARPSN